MQKNLAEWIVRLNALTEREQFDWYADLVLALTIYARDPDFDDEARLHRLVWFNEVVHLVSEQLVHRLAGHQVMTMEQFLAAVLERAEKGRFSEDMFKIIGRSIEHAG